MNDDQKHKIPAQSDEQIQREAGPSGSATEHIQDIDEEETLVGLRTDTDQGPRELNVGEEIKNTEKQEE